jgi:hypothetical protein
LHLCKYSVHQDKRRCTNTVFEVLRTIVINLKPTFKLTSRQFEMMMSQSQHLEYQNNVTFLHANEWKWF